MLHGWFKLCEGEVKAQLTLVRKALRKSIEMDLSPKNIDYNVVD